MLPDDDTGFNLWKNFSQELSKTNSTIYLSTHSYLHPFSAKHFYFQKGYNTFLNQISCALFNTGFVHWRFYCFFPYKFLPKTLQYKVTLFISSLNIFF